ncbi:MAG: hypothetical protein IJK46_06015 [Prevotella sp.]|nr:hypothetical protein [Prevotella sp.]
MEHWNDLYKDWLGAFTSIGIPAVSRDTAARVLAVTYVHGNNEALVYNKKYLSEVEHIQKMYNVDGGESPDVELVALIKQYVKELEQYRDQHDNDKTDGEVVFRNHAPEWAHKLFMERYGIKLIN